MDPASPSTKTFCGICGATSYRQVIARDTSGAMRPRERLRWSSCEREFADVQAWRQGRPWAAASPVVGE